MYTPRESPPQIVYIINSLSAGGAEKQVLLTAQMLARSGFRVCIFALKKGRHNARIEMLIGQAQQLGVLVLRPDIGGGWDLAYVGKCILRLATERMEMIVWSWGHRAEVIRAIIQLLHPSCISIVSLRSAYKKEIERLASFWQVVDLQRPHYISNSALNLELLGRHLSNIGRRSVVLYNAIEKQVLCTQPVVLPAAISSLKLVMLGNIRIEIKGYDLVVRLAAEIRRRGLAVTITIAGAENEGSKLKELIEEAGVAEIVRLVGVVERPDEYLRGGDGFLLMSRVEGMPNALIEAMCLGLPCISTKVGDLNRFTQDGENIQLVEVGDYMAVADILSDWLVDWPKAVARGIAGRELCQRLFDPAVIGQQLTTIMRQIAHDRDPLGII